MLIYGKNFNNSFENIINVFRIEKNKFFIIIFPSLLPKFEEKPLLELTFSILFIFLHISPLLLCFATFFFFRHFIYIIYYLICVKIIYMHNIRNGF